MEVVDEIQEDLETGMSFGIIMNCRIRARRGDKSIGLGSMIQRNDHDVEHLVRPKQVLIVKSIRLE